MKYITVKNNKKLILNHLTSKAISVYYYLLVLSDISGDNGVIYDFNPNKVVRLMRENGINITHNTITASIDQLIDTGLLEYGIKSFSPFETNRNIICLIDANECNEKNKLVKYVPINSIMLSELFYDGTVRSKRLFIHIYNTFTTTSNKMNSRNLHMNILNKGTNKELRSLLKVNRDQKIRDTISETSLYFSFYCIKKTNSTETYKFKINTDFIKAFDEELLPVEKVIAFNKPIKSLIDRLIKRTDSELSATAVEQLIMAFKFIRTGTAKTLVTNIIEFGENIKSMHAYALKLINAYFLNQQLEGQIME